MALAANWSHSIIPNNLATETIMNTCSLTLGIESQYYTK